MKFAILGPGGIARKMARTVKALEGMELYAIWVLTEENEPYFIVMIPTDIEFSKNSEKTICRRTTEDKPTESTSRCETISFRKRAAQQRLPP